MARPSGVNLSEAERVIYGDRALALKLAGHTYDEITKEVPVHRNTVGGLIRDAARRRSQDRVLTEEITRGIAIQRQLVEDLLRDYRASEPGSPLRERFAGRIVKAQMNLLFLSGVEVPDPEKAVTDALAGLDLQTPNILDLLSYPGVAHSPEPDPNPATTVAHPEDNSGRFEDDQGDHFAAFDPPLDY